MLKKVTVRWEATLQNNNTVKGYLLQKPRTHGRKLWPWVRVFAAVLFVLKYYTGRLNDPPFNRNRPTRSFMIWDWLDNSWLAAALSSAVAELDRKSVV